MGNIASPAAAAEQHDDRRRSLAQPPQPLDQLEAADPRHVGVDEHEGERPAGGLRPLGGLDRIGGVSDGRGMHVPASQHLFQDVAAGFVIVHHQHAHADDGDLRRRLRPLTAVGRHRQAHREMERASLPFMALDPHLAAHPFDQLGRNRQP